MKVSVFIAFVLMAVGQTRAATITVTSTADSGPGSLRTALASAANGDTIDSSSITGTIFLTSGELLVTKSVSISGPGSASLAIDGNATSRVFRIVRSTVTISGVTITNGSASGFTPNGGGGGILVMGCPTGAICTADAQLFARLTLSNSTVSGNSAIYGGGIDNWSRSTTIIVNSTLSGNDAGGEGGAIFNWDDGTVSVTNCTFSENLAGRGGGIRNMGNSVTLINSTFSGNSADYDFGGGVHNCGLLTVTACTFSGNSGFLSGGGIFNGGSCLPGAIKSAIIGNTILNAGASGANLGNNGGTITSQGYNLSSDGGGGFLTAAGDQSNTNPMLGPLADNGGPTFTHALMASSPAIDKGKNFSTSATDQRGQPRTFDDPNVANASGGDGTDIGAYETSELRITALDVLDNDLRLSFTSMLGTNYEVQSRPDLTSGTWGSLPGSTPGNGGIAQTIVTNALSQTQQFYRVHLLP